MRGSVNNEYHVVKFHHVIKTTDKAVLISYTEDGNQTDWIPLSLIEDTLDEEVGELEVPQWFADKQGWL